VLRAFRFPVGPDAPVYLWWTRLAGAEGLSTVERPGAIALLGVLRWTGVGLPASVAGAECALGAAVGLGAAALARVGGGSRAAWGLAGALAGTFATHLVAGYLSNLAFAVVFLAALAVLAERSPGAPAAAAVLVGAGGLTHPLFLLVGSAVLVLAGLLALGSDREETRRSVVAVVGGVLVAGVGWLAMRVGPPMLQTDTSQDAFLRRAGLGDTLAHAYRDRLIHRWTRYVQWASVPLAAIGAREPLGWVRRALWAWVGVTVAGVIVGSATAWFPPDRFITFGYAIPILAAFGLVALVGRRSRYGAAAPIVASALALAMVAGSGIAWLREKPYLGTEAVDAVATAARYASGAPAATPWLFPVDSSSSRISFLATRLQNVIRAAVPPDRIADVYVLVPPPPRGLSAANEREWWAMARLYAADAGEAARRSPPPVVIRVAAFDARRDGRRPGCTDSGQAATETRARQPVCDALDAPGISVGEGVSIAGLGSPAPVGARDATLDSSTARATIAAPLVLAVLLVTGLGWSSLVARDRTQALALAPAFGTAAVILAGVAIDRLGVRLSAYGPGILALVLAAASGWGALLLQRRRRAKSPQ
jgi:hypothetical protein